MRARPIVTIDRELRILALEIDEEAGRWPPSIQRLDVMRAAGQIRLIHTFVMRGIVSRGCGELWIQVGRDQLLRWAGIRAAILELNPDPDLPAGD